MQRFLHFAAKARPIQGSKPKNCPAGTLPINQTPWSPNHQDIKTGTGIPANGWTGIDPEGNVIGDDGEGNAINLGPIFHFN